MTMEYEGLCDQDILDMIELLRDEGKCCTCSECVFQIDQEIGEHMDELARREKEHATGSSN